MSAAGEKPFDPTPARRRRARREGNVARSNEITSIAAFAAALLAVTAAAALAADAAIAALRDVIAHVSAAASVARRADVIAVSPALRYVASFALLPLTAAACAGSAVALVQVGGLRFSGVRFDPKRLDPVAGLKRMVGGEAVVAAARAVLGLGAAVLAVLPVVREAIASAGTLGSSGAAMALVASAALRVCGAVLCVGGMFAVADYVLVRRRWLRGLRMSLDEVRRDAKENDGDPQARARRKSVHRGIVRGGIGRVREASFVVVNPEHVAVALRYAPPEVPVPEILVRALDDAALRVKVLARELAIPIVEDVALARALYAQGEAGSTIPPATYVAVALVVAALARDGLLT